MLTKLVAPLIAASPKLKRNVWKGWYEFLARGYRLDDWTFMNYGFAETDREKSPLVLDAADEPDRYFIQLYHRVVGGVDLSGADVLEVGSGRGGGCSYVARCLSPKSVLGVDYSDNAVALSQKRHSGVPGLRFQQGDAESLPCSDASFDVVLNVESSHCYGSMERFLAEVRRVLRPGGHFLWADMRGKDGEDAIRTDFEAAGFVVRETTNITPNVVLALDHVTERKREMIRRHVPRYLLGYFEDFAGVQGTRVYESLKAGNVEYWRCAFQKP